MEIIEGLRESDGGTVSVLGLQPWPRNSALLPRIGVQLQASSFFERLTAREQLQTFGSLYGVPAKKADAMLETVGLTDKADVHVERLSGGQAQRLSIACALVHEPEVVFLDEPSAALDPQARRNLWDLLREINTSGRTVVLTTHYMDEAEILFVAHLPVFGLKLTGTWWMSIPVVLAGALAFLAIGMVVGAWAKTQDSAQTVIQMVVFPMVFLGGSFFPIDDAPTWLQTVSYAVPLRYLNEGMLNVLGRGLGPASALPEIGVLLGIALVASLVAVRLFQWDDN